MIPIDKAIRLLNILPKTDSWVIYWIDEEKNLGFTVGDLKYLLEVIHATTPIPAAD